MARWFRFYQRYRILNVNVNIIIAGFLAILVAKWPVQWVSNWIGEGRDVLKVVAAAAIDGLADILIYFLLHWVANHWRPFKSKSEREQALLDKRRGNFFAHATVIQFERYALFPIFYLVAMGGMYFLMQTGMREGWAFALGFGAAIFTTRVLHTTYWLKTGRFREDYLEPDVQRDAEEDGAYSGALLAQAIVDRTRQKEDDGDEQEPGEPKANESVASNERAN